MKMRMHELKELTQLDDLRKTLQAINTSLGSAQTLIRILTEKVEKAYADACVNFNEDGGMNREARRKLQEMEIPLSMKVTVPDAAYAWECGDDFAQTRRQL